MLLQLLGRQLPSEHPIHCRFVADTLNKRLLLGKENTTFWIFFPYLLDFSLFLKRDIYIYITFILTDLSLLFSNL